MDDSPPQPDQRKTAELARQSVSGMGNTLYVRGFAAARAILRNASVVQAGAGADLIDKSRPEEISLFYLDGEPHRKRRAAIAPYFTLKAIETRYRPVMERTAEQLLAALEKAGGGLLDRIAFRFAVSVASAVIGIDHDDLEGLSARLEAVISSDDPKRPIKAAGDEAIRRFYETDVQPSIDTRRAARQADMISSLIDDGYSDGFICTEVRGYALAGMITTREFIVMAAWHLLERPALFERFRAGSEDEQFAILDEILRLEPIVGFLARRLTQDLDVPGCGALPATTRVAIDVRAANLDPVVAGICPHAIDPDRPRPGTSGSGMSFGDGAHRCPGAQLALHESRVFLARLAAVPGLRMEEAPGMSWFRPISGYELHAALVACG